MERESLWCRPRAPDHNVGVLNCEDEPLKPFFSSILIGTFISKMRSIELVNEAINY